MPAFLKTSLTPKPQKTASAPSSFYSVCACKTLSRRHLRTLRHSRGPILHCSLPDKSYSEQKAVKLMTPAIASTQKSEWMINKLTDKGTAPLVHYQRQPSNYGFATP